MRLRAILVDLPPAARVSREPGVAAEQSSRFRNQDVSRGIEDVYQTGKIAGRAS
jgi:hypothetical protein